MPNSSFRKCCRPRSRGRARQGAVILEFVLAVPILLVALVSIVQFGVFFANMQQVTLATRVGALEASQTLPLPTSSGEPIPQQILNVIDRQLESAKLARCQVRLEHNLGGSPVVNISGDPECGCGPIDPLADPPPGEYVRLTVVVPLGEMMPNGLAMFGFDVSAPNRVAQYTTIFRHELTP